MQNVTIAPNSQEGALKSLGKLLDKSKKGFFR